MRPPKRQRGAIEPNAGASDRSDGQLRSEVSRVAAQGAASETQINSLPLWT